MPGAPTRGTPRESQVNFSREPVGIVELSHGYRTRGVSIQGKFVLSGNVGYMTRGVGMLLNVVLIPGKLTPKSIFRDGT